MQYDILIVGGGLAGLTAALCLSGAGRSVVVFEINPYPTHKVCGEYISFEVVPYLQSIGINLDDAVKIDQLVVSDLNGLRSEVDLPLGGIGISRHALDNRLYKKAIQQGVEFVFEKVIDLQFVDEKFTVSTDLQQNISAKVAIGAYGKRSGLDKVLNRTFTVKNAPWLAVKSHYRHADFPKNQVALHSFEGGYGGLSRTETDSVNFCYLANYKSFGRYRNIEEFNKEVVSANTELMNFLLEAEPLFDKPLSIAQVSFERKKLVENNVLMCGDAAGLIHPLCGNGMAMAIHSGKMAAEHVNMYLAGVSKTRSKMENAYKASWRRAFGKRLWWGRMLQSVLLNPTATGILIGLAAKSKSLTRSVIRQTHGTVLEA